jgi:hypothetical protein
MLRVRVTRHVTRLVVDNFSHAACLGASARRAARCAATSPRTASRRLLHLRRAYGCLGTSRGSSSTSSPTPHVRVPRNVARHVECLVVDYFTYAACPGASAHRAARRVARHRLLHLRRASGFPGTSHGSLSISSPTPRVRVPRHVVRLVIDYFATRRLVVDYFAYAAHSGASERRAAHLTRLVIDYFAYAVRTGASARRAARRRLLLPRCVSGCLGKSRGSTSTTSPCTARRRLLRLRRAYGCLGTSRGSLSTTSPMPHVRVPRHVARLIVDYFASHGSSSTTSPTSCVRVPRHVARLVIHFFAHSVRPGASAVSTSRGMSHDSS